MTPQQNSLVALIRIAGAVQLAIVVANAFIPWILRYREGLRAVPPILRQVFVVHAVYIVLVLVIFGLLGLFFAPDMAGDGTLGRFLSASLACFWGLRVLLQLLYYDPEVRRRHRALDIIYTAALLFLTGTFAAAVFAPGR
jgi:hypothetical protein